MENGEVKGTSWNLCAYEIERCRAGVKTVGLYERQRAAAQAKLNLQCATICQYQISRVHQEHSKEHAPALGGLNAHGGDVYGRRKSPRRCSRCPSPCYTKL